MYIWMLRGHKGKVAVSVEKRWGNNGSVEIYSTALVEDTSPNSAAENLLVRRTKCTF